MTSLNLMITDGFRGWWLQGDVAGPGPNISTIANAAYPNTKSNVNTMRTVLTWDAVNNTTSGSINGVTIFNGCDLKGTQISPANVQYAGIDRDAALGPNSMVDNFKFVTTAAVAPALVTTPNVVGLSQTTAITSLNSVGLANGTITQQISSIVPAGSVISQTPAAGTATIKGNTVNLVVSSGPAPILTPNVVGQSQAAAVSSLTSSGLIAGNVTQQNSATVVVGNVISQNPAAGASVASGSAVDLVVSSGPLLISVPNVTGVAQSAAQSALVTSNLTLGTVTTSSSANVPAGIVISQLPLAGASIASGSPVSIIVSSGPVASPLASLAIPQVTSTFLAGDTQSLAAIGKNTNGTGQDMSAQVTWTSSNPSIATVSNTGVVTALSAGSVTVTATQAGISASTVITILAQNPSDTLPPTATLTSPLDDATVTGITTITGTASDANFLKYVIDYASEGQANFTTLATGTSPVANGTLGSFDPTTLLNDIYTLRLTVYDQGGNSSQTSVNVQVARHQKIGNFTVGFQDLTIPVAGIPITISRVYDSRNKTSSDFGFGWSLDMQTIRLHVQRNQGKGWQVLSSGGFFPSYSINPTRSHKISLNMPDGRVEEFDMQPTPNTQSAFQGPFTYPDGISYIPRPGTQGTLVATGQPGLYISGSQPGVVEIRDITTLVAYDAPQDLQYTTPEGRVFSFHGGVLQTVIEPNGNSISIGPNGIAHSSGKGVAFQRDAQGRIIGITDPNGNQYHYSYDGQGNLVSYTDPLANSTGYTYDFGHGLLSITDPRGITPLRNVYDDSGRLIQTIDSAGNAINYSHDLNTQQEVIKDRLGNITIHEYDANGNVVKTTDALGGVTTRTYDANDNTLSETDPLGRTRNYSYDAQNNKLLETDPLGNTTTYTYDASNHPLTVTDPLGHVTTNSYDIKGNLLTTTNALGNITTNAFDASGRQIAQTDALGHVTSFQYDAAGNMTQQTDALGHNTASTFDTNGNRLTETTTRTLANGTVESLVTSFTYDAKNRLIKTTEPDGSSTQTVYDVIGKQSQSIDALGRITLYQYDDFGRLIKTTYPDGKFETSSYDLEGHKISSTDRAGHVTATTSDALGRQVKTTYPDGTSTQTNYDAAGQQISTVDTLGYVSRSSYDAAGRRVQSIGASNNQPNPSCGTAAVTCITYDNASKQTKVTDANGNITQFSYDAAGRRTQVIYPDLTAQQTLYDALGHKIKQTDQAGKITQFGYDAVGHLVKVTNALNQVTSYGYDERGQQTSQTDANNHTTTFAYDNRGHRVARTLPGGQSESMSYDILGNLMSKTDFNGKTSTYAYDSLNRLLSKTPDSSLNQPQVTYSYTDSGQRASMTDASGTTTYSYDNADRLVSKATPQGTLNYGYDLAGRLASISSLNPNGVSIDYAYDALSRLSSVIDANLVNGTTSYHYDNVGNLADYSYPNGVTTRYTYNNLNRLTNMALDKAGTPLASYAYTLGATGNRLSVAELGGRTVSYLYDDLYRLARETITADPNTINGQVDYVYDPVGNRLSRTSTLSGIANQTFTYDANDRLNTDTYDPNGNTIGSSGKSYNYDFDNHLTNQNGNQVTIVYDGDGNRVAETVAGVTTQYLVDTLNPTGYAQVLEEIQSGSVTKRYTYGSDLISQSFKAGPNWENAFYGYDAIGSTRILTTSSGLMTDTYTYDSFGNVMYHIGNLFNQYLFSGEENDPMLGFYYLRARYFNSNKGSFETADTINGQIQLPKTLHKYVYASNDPVNLIDPSGNEGLDSTMAAVSISSMLYAMPEMSYGYNQAGCSINPGDTEDAYLLEADAAVFVDMYAVVETMYTNSTNAYDPALNGHCAQAFRQALEAGIPHQKIPGHPGLAKNWGAYLTQYYGFNEIQPDYNDFLAIQGYRFQPGDVVVFQSYPNQQSAAGHIQAMSLKYTWVSDFKQHHFIPGSNYKNIPFKVYRNNLGIGAVNNWFYGGANGVLL